MTFAALIQTADGVLAVADGWTHYPDRAEDDCFTTKKLVDVRADGLPVVVVFAGRASLLNRPVTEIVEESLVAKTSQRLRRWAPQLDI